VTFKVIQRHWQWCHSIGHIRFPISVPLQLGLCLYMSLSCTVNKILSLVSQNSRRSLDPAHIPFGSNMSSGHQYSYVSISTRNLKYVASPIPNMIRAKFLKQVTWLWPRPLGSCLSSKAKRSIHSTGIQNMATVASVVPKNCKICHVTLTTPLYRVVCHL